MRLEYISPDDLNRWWPVIGGSFKSLEGKVSGKWIAEDFFRWIKNGEQYLHLALDDDDKYYGFITTQQEQYPDGVAMYISALYSHYPNEFEVLNHFWPEMLKWATSINAKRITFCSPRRGWEKNKLGFELEHVKYSYEMGE